MNVLEVLSVRREKRGDMKCLEGMIVLERGGEAQKAETHSVPWMTSPALALKGSTVEFT